MACGTKPNPARPSALERFLGLFTEVRPGEGPTGVYLYNDERGKRLFPMIAIGATSGAVTGSWIAKHSRWSGWRSR